LISAIHSMRTTTPTATAAMTTRLVPTVFPARAQPQIHEDQEDDEQEDGPDPGESAPPGNGRLPESEKRDEPEDGAEKDFQDVGDRRLHGPSTDSPFTFKP
jgi:hypothetical protein